MQNLIQRYEFILVGISSMAIDDWGCKLSRFFYEEITERSEDTENVVEIILTTFFSNRSLITIVLIRENIKRMKVNFPSIAFTTLVNMTLIII